MELGATATYHYDLPRERIAQRPVEPRDSSRLLVVPGLRDLTFHELPELLDPGDLLVVNDTRVRHARLRGTKPTGGAVEVLLTERLDDLCWRGLIRPARRIKIGTEIDFGALHGRVVFGPMDGIVELELQGRDGADPDDVLPAAGEVPLPPYIHESLPDAERYQTIFAKRFGSAAAPTAGLHFTPELVERVLERGLDIAAVDLHVGLDTFRPISVESLDDHAMHTETYSIPQQTAHAVAVARHAGRRIVAVGTTSLRALESAARPDGTVAPGSGIASLFIRPGYEFRVIDGLVTNFHAPGTTLLVLLAALYPDWKAAYQHALSAGYRFLSFGDAMAILPPT